MGIISQYYYLTFYDIFFYGYQVEYLDVLSIIALIFGISVIINKNPISSLMSLIGLFASIALYLILLGLTFIGFSYLIVYIGAVSILFLFILMLINIRRSELQSNNLNSIPLALFVAILLNYALRGEGSASANFVNANFVSANFVSAPRKINNMINYLSTTVPRAQGGVSIPCFAGDREATPHAHEIWLHGSTGIGDFSRAKHPDLNTANVMFVTSNNWDGNMAETSHMSTIGNILYTSYNIWLFIASIILLLAMTGAIIITIKQDNYKQ